jgi:hypothetical protein
VSHGYAGIPSSPGRGSSSSCCSKTICPASGSVNCWVHATWKDCVATTYSSSVISSTKLQAPAKSAFNFKQGANVVLHVPRRIEHRRAGREDVVRVVVERLEGILQRCAGGPGVEQAAVERWHEAHMSSGSLVSPRALMWPITSAGRSRLLIRFTLRSGSRRGPCVRPLSRRLTVC